MKMMKYVIGLVALTAAMTTSAANWPPESGAKVAGNALEVPTKLEAVSTSLESMLNNGADIITSYIGENGPVVTIKHHHRYVICRVTGAGTGSDQNVATSKCYALN
ncbi:MAG: hypothetical protein ACK5NC_03890 [Vibrio sp.]